MRLETLPITIKMIADCPEIDAFIFHIAFDTWSLIAKNDIVDPAVASLLKLKNTLSKPMAVVLHCQATDPTQQLAAEVQQKLCQAGFAVYPSMKRAATALNRFIQYHEWRQDVES